MNYLNATNSRTLAPCPQTGGGVNDWLLKTARRLHREGMAPNSIHAFLRDGSAGCGRPVTDGEIRRQIERSGGQRSTFASRPLHSAPEWLPYNEERVASIVNARDAMTVYDLWEASPVRLGDGCTEYVIDTLFPGNPLLCCGWSTYRFATRTREEWRGRLGEMALLVTSPMSAVEGMKDDGTLSMHTKANTGPRMYLDVELDRKDLDQDQQSAILWHLATMAPLAMVIYSAGKSLHGWFVCGDTPEPVLHKFIRYAVTLGADKAVWKNPSQFERMPDGVRIDKPEDDPSYGKRQPVYYFNPQVLR